ncbi:hypothetical protein ACHRVZ_12610 [Flavobacterium sp. FlaQc-57]|uniref:TRADD-N-associated membrane domain-containing protein n=1 Tax=Flavobacterium sp. FlaQc-57 TaxID=3374186 RepID=UPI0037576E1C
MEEINEIENFNEHINANSLDYKVYRKQELEETKERLLGRLRRQKKLSRFSMLTGIFIIIATIAMYYISDFSRMYFVIMIGYAIIILSFPFINSNPEAETQIQQVQNELDLLEIEDSSIEMRAEKLFKYHQLELKKYYDQTLRHSSWIFLTGLFCIICGFAFIGTTLYLIFNNKSIEFNEKILLGSIGTLSTLLSNFIGAIYLKMYSETLKSLTEFHNRLVITHHLHFGNYLTSKITDKVLREKTLSDLTLKIAENKS